MENNVKLSAPWETLWNEMRALFEADPEIGMSFDEETKTIKLFVTSQDKASALEKILPDTVEFGNVTVNINIIPANDTSRVGLYTAAFKGNPNFCFATARNVPPMPSLTYVVFQPRVAQFFNDNIQDYYGNKNILIQDIAKEVLKPDAEVCFSTARIGEDDANG